MSLWLIVPHDPLIFRDGKPFTATPGERSKSLGFPFPSTLAGAVRTRLGPDPQTGEYDENRVDWLKGVAMRGPVLVELNADGQISNRFFPAPADALLLEKESKQTWRYSLAPLTPPPGALTDLEGLALVGAAEQVKDKPSAKAPRYWNWSAMQAWLEQAQDGAVSPDGLGIQGPAREFRTHVSIDPEMQASKEGALFQTSGMEYMQSKREKDDSLKLSQTRPLALAVETEAELKEGADFLGGERRVVCWIKSPEALPKCPETVRQQIIEQKHCRLILATPAYFAKGYLPGYLESGFGAKIVAAALPRYQTISGWDYARPNGGEPKPTRRLAPAGSVYFLNLENVKDKDIGAFIEKVWLQSISDDEQAQRDGFGLALLGAWDGVMQKMKMEVKS